MEGNWINGERELENQEKILEKRKDACICF
jgi:hypothetical protein